MLHSLFCLIDKCCCRCISLPTTVSAASASLAVNNNYHMSAFAAGIVNTRYNLTVNDNARAYTGAECNGNKVFGTVAATCISLAESGTVSVVCNINRLVAESFDNHILCRDIVKIKVVCKLDNTVGINSAGCAETYRRNIVHCKTGFFDSLFADLCNIIKNKFCTARNGSRRFCLCDNIVFFVNNSGNNISSAQINTDSKHNYTPFSFLNPQVITNFSIFQVLCR